MYTCTTCGKPISSTAPICFNCGTVWGRWGSGPWGSEPSYGPSYGPGGGTEGCIWPILFVLFVMFALCGGCGIFKIFLGG